jgi:hypothetical protein
MSKKDEKISEEIAKMMREYKKTGKIQTSDGKTYEPENQGKAQKQAAAIAYGKYNKGQAGKN